MLHGMLIKTDDDDHLHRCGHCRTLEPIYRRVGQSLNSVKHIDVMKMDATQNEINLMIGNE